MGPGHNTLSWRIICLELHEYRRHNLSQELEYIWKAPPLQARLDGGEDLHVKFCTVLHVNHLRLELIQWQGRGSMY